MYFWFIVCLLLLVLYNHYKLYPHNVEGLSWSTCITWSIVHRVYLGYYLRIVVCLIMKQAQGYGTAQLQGKTHVARTHMLHVSFLRVPSLVVFLFTGN